MTSNPQAQTADADGRVNIRLEQVRMIYAAVPLSLAAVIINGALLGAVLWGTIPDRNILVWLGLTYAISVPRWFLYRRFQQQSEDVQQQSNWYHLALLSALVSGAVWGSTAVFLFPTHSLPHQLFLAFVIAGMSAGAVTTLSSVFSMAAGFLSLLLLPLIIRFVSVDTMLASAMAVMTTLFAGMIMLSALRLNRTILESLQIRYERQLAEDTIRRQALYDDLTDLPNRRLLLELLQQELARSERHGNLGAVMFLDVDRFKNVNDSLGHRAGDKLLQEVARRLRRRLRKEDTAARIGGDEFVVLVTEIGQGLSSAALNTQHIANDLLESFRQPFKVDGYELHLSVSIGVTLFPAGQYTPEDLLQQADVAMVSAKECGVRAARLFLPDMQEAVDRRLEIERGLRLALNCDGFELHYQPQVRLGGELAGAEALVRWQHPSLGAISPLEFIGVAEETGLIYQLGDWILRRACEDLASLPAEKQLHVSVNISPRQFRADDFIDRIKDILAETGAPASRLTLEITETVVIDDLDQTVEKMRALKALGISFSVDDFGTGHSSLAYLKRLPLDVIKIDQSFVRGVCSDPNDAVIVETIIVMSRHLGLEVIAEGVETEEALAFLEQHGCRFFQGYLFARPEPFAAFIERIESDESDHEHRRALDA